MNDSSGATDRLDHMLDSHGSDFSRWPDQTAAAAARRAALSDHGFRQKLNQARRVDAALDGVAQRLDLRLAESGAEMRLRDRLLAQVTAQSEERRFFSPVLLSRFAAAMLVACGLGVAASRISPLPASLDPQRDELALGFVDLPLDENSAI